MKKAFRAGVVMAAAAVVVLATVGWGGTGPARGQNENAGGGLVTTVAEAVDMTVAEVRAEIHDSKTFSDILAEYGVDVEAIVAQTLSRMEACLLQAVDDGRITEELAAERLASAEARIIERLEMSAPLGPMWGDAQTRGRHGRGFGASTRGFGSGMGRGMGGGQGFGPGQGWTFPAAPVTNS